MPFIPTPHCVQVNMRFTQDGQMTENVFHVMTVDASPTQTELIPIAETFFDWWSSTMRNYFSSSIALREVYAFNAASVSGQTYTYVPSSPVGGTSAAAALPNNCALVATKRTINRGRSFRGRTYWGGIPETDVNVSLASNSYVADLNSACSVLLAQLSADGYPMSVRSLKNGGDWRAVGLQTPVTSFGLKDGIIDSQRRRTPGVGS